MRRVLWLVRKDLWRFVSDRFGALLTVIMPVALAALLGLLFQPPGSGEVLVLVVDGDGGSDTAALVDALDAEPSVRVERVDDAEARRRLTEGVAPVAVRYPKGTGAALRPDALGVGEPVAAELVYDPSRRAEAEIAMGALQRTTSEQLLERLREPAQLEALFKTLRSAAVIDQLPGGRSEWLRFTDAGIDLARTLPTGDSLELAAPLTYRRTEITAEVSGSTYDTHAHTFAGMLCMFLLFWSMDAARELVGEREAGLLVRVRLAPVRRWHVLVARALSMGVIAVLISACVYAVAMAAFGVEVRGSWLGFVLVLLSQAIFAASFAVLLAGLAGSERQLTSVGTFAILLMSFIGGAWVPSFLMPDWLGAIGRALPTSWATQGLAAMTWRGQELSAALAPCGVLLAFSAASLAVGLRMFRWSRSP